MEQRRFTPTMLLLLQLFRAWLPITGIRWNGGVGSIWRHPVPDDTWPTLTDWVWIKQTWWSRSSYCSWFYGQHLRSGESKRVSTMKARRVRKKYMFHRSRHKELMEGWLTMVASEDDYCWMRSLPSKETNWITNTLFLRSLGIMRAE